MELDFVEYLRLARPAFRAVASEWEVPLPQTDILLNDYLNLDVTLSQLVWLSDTINVDAPASVLVRNPAVQLVDVYASALAAFLMISHQQQWTHLMVLEEEDLAKFGRFQQIRFAHQFVGIKTMLWNSYHQRTQTDFSHAWRAFLKLGLVELGLTQAEIDQAVRKVLANEDSV